MAASEDSLRRALVEKQSTIESQGNAVRALKASNAEKKAVDEAIEKLNALKLEKSSIEKQLQASVSGNPGSSVSKEAFRQAVVNTLVGRLFFIPSFKIYGGVAGLYDYGPPGCAVKSNVLAFWRQHFVLEENMLEVDCPCVTPEVVLKASGHVDKFTDLMVKDEKTGTCYRADHLLKDFCNEKIQKDLSISAEKAAELKHILAVLDDLSAEELGAKIKEYGITAPDTRNPLSDPYPFNLMFQTSIGPSGLSPGYMRPETAQGIFVNFKDLYYYNGNKLPFAAAQIGQAFRNEISPRQGLLRVREFTLAEIEHFVDPDDKSHPKYSEVADLEFLMFPREQQISGQSAKKTCLGEAVSKGIVNNETLGYFIGRVYLFLTRLGIDKDRLRFRQHLAKKTGVDRFSLRQAVIFICATNRPDELDLEFVRPGRIDRRLYIGLADAKQRVQIFGVHSVGKQLAEDVDFEKLVFRTVGFSGADIRNLVNEAAIMSVRKGRSKVYQQDIVDVLDKQLLEGMGVLLTEEEQQKCEQNVSFEKKHLLAVHEAGHILLAHLFPRFDWHAFSQLLPGGKETAISVFYPREDMIDQGYTTFGYMKMQMVVAHGGRCAERLVYGEDITDGGSDDLEKITKIAREMAISPQNAKLGLTALTKRVGLMDRPDNPGGELIKYRWDDPHVIPANMTLEVSELFTREMTRYVEETEELAMEGLRDNRHILDVITKELLEKSRVTGLEVEDLMKELSSAMFEDFVKPFQINLDEEGPLPHNDKLRFQPLDIYPAPLHR